MSTQIEESTNPAPPFQSQHANGVEETVRAEVAAMGEPWQDDSIYDGAVGRTMFDTPSSEDHSITVLLPAEEIQALPSQALVRIKSRTKASGGDGRTYLGAVVAGPFAEPDGLRADAPIVVTTTVRGAQFLPRFHGRAQISIMGEEVDGVVQPPRLRPLPNSPVFAISEEETRQILGLEQENPIELGFAVGFQNLPVQIPARNKNVLPRHMAVLGTTGGGKSTTVSGLIAEFSRNGIATIVIDTEGEYTEIGMPTVDATMTLLLQRMGREPHGIENVQVRYLVNRETTAPASTPSKPFQIRFSSLSPYAAAELMELSEAQNDRFTKAYDVAKGALQDAGIFPRPDNPEDERRLVELNEFETGYPGLTVNMLYDIVEAFYAKVQKSAKWEPSTPKFKDEKVRAAIWQRVVGVDTNNPTSWNILRARINRLVRTDIFDNASAFPLPFKEMLQPGQTTLIDLSDSDSTMINNLAIANLLQGVAGAQEEAYQAATARGESPTPVVIIIEEAHEFLSSERVKEMPTLFEQVARLARRGRKRWLGLCFVTQLPQHLPDEVLGLVNNHVLHKITDVNVVNRLRRSIGGVDESLWKQLPSLAPGQAIVSAASMARPMLVTINPTPTRLRMID